MSCVELFLARADFARSVISVPAHHGLFVPQHSRSDRSEPPGGEEGGELRSEAEELEEAEEGEEVEEETSSGPAAALVAALRRPDVLRGLAAALAPFLTPQAPPKRGRGRPKLASVSSDGRTTCTPQSPASPSEHPSKAAARSALGDVMKTVTVRALVSCCSTYCA